MKYYTNRQFCFFYEEWHYSFFASSTYDWRDHKLPSKSVEMKFAKKAVTKLNFEDNYCNHVIQIEYVFFLLILTSKWTCRSSFFFHSIEFFIFGFINLLLLVLCFLTSQINQGSFVLLLDKELRFFNLISRLKNDKIYQKRKNINRTVIGINLCCYKFKRNGIDNNLNDFLLFIWVGKSKVYLSRLTSRTIQRRGLSAACFWMQPVKLCALSVCVCER